MNGSEEASSVQQSIFKGLMPLLLAFSSATSIPYPPFRISTILSCQLAPHICSLYGEGQAIRISRNITAVIARIAALRKAGNQSCRSLEFDGDTASRWSCWKACRIVIRAVRMLFSNCGTDIAEGAALLETLTNDLYSSQTVINTVQDASRDLF